MPAHAHIDPGLVAAFPAKFGTVVDILADWTKPIGGLVNKRVLDFGCGEGASALGLALRHQPAHVLGIDINAEHRNLAAIALANGIAGDLPANLAFEEVDRGEVGAEGSFDLIYAWSVFEHVDQALFAGILTGLRDKLRPAGHLFVQIAPLYYSPEGSHLWAIGYRHWEHLTKQVDHIRRDLYSTLAKPHADSLWSTFITLNKITAPKLITEVCSQGFDLVREHRTLVEIVPSADLLVSHAREALVTDQIVAMFKRR